MRAVELKKIYKRLFLSLEKILYFGESRSIIVVVVIIIIIAVVVIVIHLGFFFWLFCIVDCHIFGIPSLLLG